MARAGRERWVGWGRCAALVLLALLATGCQARLALDVTVDADGAGTLAVTLTADAELRAQARSAGSDPLDQLVETGERLSDAGWSVTDRRVGDGSREVTLSVGFATPEEFDALATDLVAALDAPEVALLEALSLEVTDDVVRVDAVAGMVPTGAVADYGLAPAEATAALASEQPLVYELTVSLPGQVLETTALDPEGTPLRWEVPPGERVEIVAVAERPRAALWATIAAAGGLGGLLALVAGWLVVRRRR